MFPPVDIAHRTHGSHPDGFGGFGLLVRTRLTVGGPGAVHGEVCCWDAGPSVYADVRDVPVGRVEDVFPHPALELLSMFEHASRADLRAAVDDFFSGR